MVKDILSIKFGGVAQPDRARGSYPLGREFKSLLRHKNDDGFPVTMFTADGTGSRHL